MADFSDSLEETKDAQPSMDDIQSLMKDKAHELFSVCDTEQKGFITKRDMQRLQGELPLSPEQLENVFDSLDDDGNGYLTLEEFTEGFGSFLGVDFAANQQGMDEQVDTFIDEDPELDPVEEQHNYHKMMNNIGAVGVLEEEPAVKSLWCRLRKEDQDMASNFEDFLYRVSNELRRSKNDFETLEGAFKSKTTSHDEEVRKLYDEMESQIKAEKEKVLADERAREKQMRDKMEMEIFEKDRQLQEMMARQAEMEEKLGYLNTVEAETKIENEKLLKDKEDLEESLIRSQMNLEESKSYINQLREQQKNDKRARAKAALQLTEGIALERETLVKQLDMLKHMNRKLQDDKDEAETRRSFQDSMSLDKSMEQEMEEATPKSSGAKKRQLSKQGSIMGKYFDPPGDAKHSKQPAPIPEDVGGEGQEVGVGIGEGVLGEGLHKNGEGLKSDGVGFSQEVVGLMDLDDYDDIECDDDMYMNGHSPSFIHPDINASSPNIRYRSDSEHEVSDRDDVDGPSNMTQSAITNSTPTTPRAQPVGADGSSDFGRHTHSETSVTLQRVFKVVIVGDSGVGKSSFLQRYCSNQFKGSYNATIGVDFQIKSLNVEGQTIVLQLWDTAGQERFRAITKQYFRKADGVIIMYDVSSETTFTNVRHWITSVREGVSDTVVMVLLGNKNDIPESEDSKVVLSKYGSRLADDEEAMFYETSALSGENVAEAMEALARKLKEKEDREIEKSLHLEEFVKKKKCCR